MKKIFLFLCFAFGMLFTSYAESTTDNVVITPRAGYVLAPGNNDGKFYITVSLSGSTHYYTGFNMDIELPDGVETVYDDKGKIKIMLRTVENGMFPPTKTVTGYDDDDEPIYSTTYVSHTIQAENIVIAGKRYVRIACVSTENIAFEKVSGDIFRLYLTANSFAKPGTPDINIIGTSFGVYDALAKTTTPYKFDDAISNAVTVSTSAQAPVSVNNTFKWSTCILPFACSLPAGMKAYGVTSVEDDALVLEEANSISAYTPYLINAEEGFSGNLEGTVDPANYPAEGYVKNGLLCGAIKQQQKSQGYVLQNLAEGFMFYNMDGQTFSIPAGKCWLEVPSSNAKSFGWIDKGATGINAVKVVKSSNDIYTLDGVKVSKMVPGQVYIKGGKKILCTK